jgi:hypothetical protein
MKTDILALSDPGYKLWRFMVIGTGAATSPRGKLPPKPPAPGKNSAISKSQQKVHPRE